MCSIQFVTQKLKAIYPMYYYISNSLGNLTKIWNLPQNRPYSVFICILYIYIYIHTYECFIINNLSNLAEISETHLKQALVLFQRCTLCSYNQTQEKYDG